MRRSLLAAAACTVLLFAWQAFAVYGNYHGNWTALFCTGAKMPVPASLHETIWTFKNSYGYDGQMYHYIAHDPWFKRGLDQYVDARRMRYQRILLPGLAHLLAFGEDRYVDAAYIVCVLLCIFLGSLWLGQYAQLHRYSPWIGLAFAAVPAVLVSIDRLTVDVVLACLCVGFALFVERCPGWPLYTVLAVAPLARETGFILLGSYVGALLLKRQFRRAAIFITAGLPALAWYRFVALHTATENHASWFSLVPFSGYFQTLLHPVAYPFSLPVVAVARTLDYAALAGIGLAIGWVLILLYRRAIDPLAAAIYGFTALAAFLSLGEIWAEAYAYGRSFTPLLLLLAIVGLRTRRLAMAVPMLLVTPRILLQFAALAYYAFGGKAL
ncbi:MAG TPA: hypothetical protein VKU01_15575 [Bryobacteraceae bacterium]|nr:hypothetical protein [Bryobacteraceae bacterium]